MCLISKNRKKKYFLLQISLKLGCDFTAWPWPLVLSVAHEYRTGVCPGGRNVESQVEVQVQLDLEMMVITLPACLK